MKIFNIYILYIIWYIHIYILCICFPRPVTDQTNSRFRSLLEDGAPKPFNADEDISFFFGAWKNIRYLSEANNLWRWREHDAESPVVQDLLNKKLGITGQHIPWTGSLVIHPLHKVIYLFHSIETWIEKWPNIFLKNTEVNHIMYIYIYSCFVMSDKAYHQKENNELSWGRHSSVWFPPAIDHFTIWVCPGMWIVPRRLRE